MDIPKCNWSLGNGQMLGFGIYDCTKTGWSAVAGLYIFAYIHTANDGKRSWKPLYIGQANPFSSRMASHERFTEAVRKGATHIHAAVVPLAANRDTWERLLISTHQPQMNEQYKGLGLLGLRRMAG